MVSTDRTGTSTSGSGLPLGYASGDYVTTSDPEYADPWARSFSTPLVSGWWHCCWKPPISDVA